MTILAPDGEEVGKKEICSKFDNIIISCVQGICKNVSEVYSCTFDSILVDLERDRGGRGECHCAQCGPEEKKVGVDWKSDWRFMGISSHSPDYQHLPDWKLFPWVEG